MIPYYNKKKSAHYKIRNHTTQYHDIKYNTVNWIKYRIECSVNSIKCRIECSVNSIKCRVECSAATKIGRLPDHTLHVHTIEEKDSNQPPAMS